MAGETGKCLVITGHWPNLQPCCAATKSFNVPLLSAKKKLTGTSTKIPKLVSHPPQRKKLGSILNDQEHKKICISKSTTIRF